MNPAPKKSKPPRQSAAYAVRVTEDVYAELLRRQAARFARDGKRTSLAALVAEAVRASS